MPERVVNVDVYVAGTLPDTLFEEALRTGAVESRGRGQIANQDLIVVRTMCAEDGSERHTFEHVGNSPKAIKAFMHRLAAEDGVDLNKAVEMAFGDI